MSRRCTARRWVLLSLSLGFAWFGFLVQAPAADKPQVDPKAQKVIDAFGKYISGLKGFSFSAKTVLSIEQMGQKQENAFEQKYSAERPNKLAYLVDSPQGVASVDCDGTDMSIFLETIGRYGTEAAPATWADMIGHPLVLSLLSFGNSFTVSGAILNADPAKQLIEKSEQVRYGGVVEVDGVKCHLIASTSEEMDWQLWIDAGDKPIPRQFTPDLAKPFERMAKTNNGRSPFGDAKVSNVVTYHDWKGNPKFGDKSFAFTAPERAKKVKNLADILKADAEEEDAGPHPLLGKPAPAINVDLLQGGSFDLATFKNKRIVILDFWATWCEPCLRAMPIIEEVAGKFKSKGVVLVAVNAGETPDEVRPFVKEHKLDLTIALDKDGAVSMAYKAEAIPQTVLIGKDGTVQAVYVGLSPDLHERLTKDLEALVAGKNIAAETIAAAGKKATGGGDAPAKSDKPSEDSAPGKKAGAK